MDPVQEWEVALLDWHLVRKKQGPVPLPPPGFEAVYRAILAALDGPEAGY